ncbi:MULTISPECIES: GerAB/ArcD/ProY family transporter [Brevibacillus]|jgi:spore germination protein (amino acid permease)|uniref:Spore germination protein n=1 Tax=Brevibacillus borstelensis AK1 TaxID=1300222 RepID=M8DA56_9BACL|nr:GerAB/ArcD/ProY family transporter [Brevibacillus borstelensis]EMT50187.1 spore germination protein [Brevibacillus borstelensis AK1]MBE5397402.1 GerAB/ArcD/ProY family transporter [Brevibacillus borstelensis]MCC0562943.1 spore germination protein [Brevibacillus borstelensis]MCM3470393.1 spore germination protein [Brevibacillus borstelensis]MCM3557212.1 spore germination protein [Brevibacillus borstelensis]
MDKGKLEKLNPFHVTFLIINVIVGMNLLTLPHSLSMLGYDQWWMPVVMCLLAHLTLFPMVALCRRYPGDTLFVINEKLLGKWLGYAVNGVLIVYGLLMVASISAGYIRLVQTSMLNTSTITYPLLGLLSVMIYISLGGIKAIARFCILTFFFTFWMLYYLQWGFQKGNIMHIFPLFQVNVMEIVAGVHNGFFSFLGYELILFYYPYVQKKEQVFRHASIGLWVVCAIYVFVLIASVSYFSVWQVTQVVYPILNLFKAVELSFIERVENLGIGLWVFLVLSTGAGYLWMAKKGIDRWRRKNSVLHLYIATIIVYFSVRGPLPIPMEILLYGNGSIYFAYGVILWPLVLLLLHAIREKRGGDTL